MNYTKIQVVFTGGEVLYITEDEVVVYQLSEDYLYMVYMNDNKDPHRLDGPAWNWADGSKSWWENGERHRAGGLPAIEGAEGYKEWWMNGRKIK